ncbi:capsular biosynthesis protein [Candidatus Saccharibacteria bacterium]|nr:capsular biosynthesis protein [Candidatus Saccharibacteria bacterium]
MYKDIKLIFDVDGTLCPLKKPEEEYIDLIPDQAMVKKLRDYKNSGATIVLFSSRNMRTYNGNLGLINANTARTMQEWLSKWDIPYDEIYFGKPWPGHRGLYIDDRAVRPNEFLKYSFDELETICKQSTRKHNKKG